MVLATYIHVCSALIALSAAAVAVSVKKGKQPHIGAGYLFVITMIIMAIPAGVLSYQAGKMFDVLSSLLTGYMVEVGRRMRLAAPDLSLPAFYFVRFMAI